MTTRITVGGVTTQALGGSPSFVEHELQATIKLATNTQTNQPQTFTGTGLNTLTLQRHRAALQIQNSGGVGGSTAQLVVWGLAPSLINQLTTLGMVMKGIPNNTITITAGDAVSGMSTVFFGTILNANPDFSSMPDVRMRFECQAGAAEATIPFAPSNFAGAPNAVQILSAIAKKSSWGFEDNLTPQGVTVVLNKPYYSGSAIQQVKQICDNVRIRWALVAGTGGVGTGTPGNILCIWPYYGARLNAPQPLIGPAPGQMIGYPNWTQVGVAVRTIFNPLLAMGGRFQLRTTDPSVSAATPISQFKLPVDGTWNIYKLDHMLDSRLPGGKWESIVYGFNQSFPQPPPIEIT